MYDPAMIPRADALRTVGGLLDRHRIVAVLGARQVGKTTLARAVARAQERPVTYFDLEDPADLDSLDDPMLVLRDARGLIVIDEIQRRPDLFPVLRVLADRTRPARRFLILGSASPDLLRQSSESLAGRIQYFELDGFSTAEVGLEKWKRLWLRGGFPRSYLAASDRASNEWRRGFARTYLERDIPALGSRVPPRTLGRFWAMLAHYHGQIWNASEFGRSFGVADTTVTRYLDLLVSTFVVRRLPPWHANLSKRQVKAPKVYFRDSGLLHNQIQVVTGSELRRHPKVGASWEGFALETLIAHLGARPEECYFWATHAGAELDLLVVRGRTRLGFEFKYTEAPKVTRSMQTAKTDLKLRSLQVIHAGRRCYPLGRGITAVSFTDIAKAVKPLR